jgi:hypothetical protein
MSYTVANPGGSARPATVTAASGLLYFAAAIQVISIVLSFFAFGPIQEVINEQFADAPEAGAVATGMRVGIIFAIAINALFAAGTIVCAVLDGRGKNPARIVTWVLGGIAVLCYACNLIGTAVSGSLANMGGGTTPEQTEIQRRVEEALPAWQGTVDLLTSVLLIVAFGGAMILLALPQSNAFFRREQEVWVPPTYPGGGYPPVAGQPDPYGQPPAQPGQYPPPPGQYPPPPGQYPPPPGQYPPPPGQYPPPPQQ